MPGACLTPAIAASVLAWRSPWLGLGASSPPCALFPMRGANLAVVEGASRDVPPCRLALATSPSVVFSSLTCGAAIFSTLTVPLDDGAALAEKPWQVNGVIDTDTCEFASRLVMRDEFARVELTIILEHFLIPWIPAEKRISRTQIRLFEVLVPSEDFCFCHKSAFCSQAKVERRSIP